ncbi:MAG: PfkB family carbohydrate kinase [Candidatus Tritonobacter lacicola]|nr:PfkB family carbohydrate kinase [Candidatus Tritonobacter lacicola]
MKKVDAHEKIKNLDKLAEIVAKLKKEGKTIVHCHGVFDLLHPGHIKHFEAAGCEGDVLVVTITEDRYVGKGPGRPVFNERLRAESIAELQCVDYVAINRAPTAVHAIEKLGTDVYVKGSDYADRESDLTGEIYKEEEAVGSVGGRIHFTDEISFSSTELLNIHFGVYHEEADEFLREFRGRYNAEDIIGKLKALKGMRVLIVGDTIIDEYHYCQPMAKAWKETVIVTKYLNRESFAGGVLAAANHVAGFCEDVHLVTCLGEENTQEEFIRNRLKPNVRPKFFYRDEAPTVVKRRYVDPVFLTKIFEICFLNDANLPKAVEADVCEYLSACCRDYDIVIVCDFGNGFIGRLIIDVLCNRAGFLAVNTQTNSANMGFNLVTKYPRADYVCIDEPEIRLATQEKFENLEELVRIVSGKLGCPRVTVTRGNRRSLGFEQDRGFVQTPVLSDEVVDRIGAGDAYLAVTSPCVAAGYPMDIVGFIGNAVGALAVRIVCNRDSVEPVPLFKFITALLK